MTVNTDIFLGSGASITKIPEFDIYFESTKNPSGAFDNSSLTTIKAATTFSTHYSLVNNLYVGCLLERYTGTTLQTTHRITANTADTITFTPAATPDDGDFFVIKGYGAPVPAKKVTGATSVLAQPAITNGGTQIEADESIIGNAAITGVSGLTTTGAELVLTLSAEISTVTFPAESGTNYDSGLLTINLASASGTNGITTLQVLFNTAGASAPSASANDSVTVAIADSATGAEIAQSVLTALAGKDVTVTRSGAELTITNNTGGYVGTHITETTTSATTIGNAGGVQGGIITAVTVTNAGSSVSGSGNLTITSNGGTNGILALAATTTTSAKRLLSDGWLGIVESVTFPTTEIETKQVNLSLGTSRNKTYQYKGIETASGGNLGIVANQGTWLYYFFGAMTSISATTLAGTPSSDYIGTEDKVYVKTSNISSTGPFFHRTVGTTLCPPNPDHLQAHTTLKELDPPTGTTTMTKGITYTIAEENGDNLPSFAMEQTLSKLEGTDKFRTDSTETLESMNFVKIARGCRVNTLSLTANENEEVKMTVDVNTRAVHALETNEAYDGRRGIEDDTNLYNYSSIAEFREPFFFSDGVFSVFNHTFLKINTLTLTMNNNLQDRRFLGVGNTSIQEAIPAERTYEIQFTGHVTDDRLYQELLNRTEQTGSGTEITLVFEKSNDEKITLKFEDYMLSANNFPIPDDKGAIVVEATVLPRTMTTCEVITHWKI
jgi:hypothetical protein